MNSKIKLPDIKAIRIRNIKETDKDYAYFLSECLPFQLDYLNIRNWSLLSLIKPRYSICSLSKAVSTVVYYLNIEDFELSAKELQQIIRAACNVIDVVFNSCSIHCSTVLDFGPDIKYKTEELSFEWWGVTKFKNLTTDWIDNPSSFTNIVDAIGNCGLRHSLKRINIKFNKTLNKVKLQKLLKAKDINNILLQS